MMNKRAQWDVYWVEYVAGVLFLLAFFIAARGAYVGVVYLITLLAGLYLGKQWYLVVKRHRTKIYISILTMAVLLGMILGSFGADRRFVVVLYVIGIVGSYIAHDEKWIRTA
jgi:hypothetical protein